MPPGCSSSRRASSPAPTGRCQEKKDQHYRGWLDESIPALDGRTPPEAARLKSARPQLIALLKGLESMEERAGLEGGPVYDAALLWRELGLRWAR